MGSVSSWCCAALTQVLYRPEGQASGMLYTTAKQSIDLPMKKGEYLVEVRAHSEGGDGAVAQVRIAGKTSAWRHYAPFHFIQNKDLIHEADEWRTHEWPADGAVTHETHRWFSGNEHNP